MGSFALDMITSSFHGLWGLALSRLGIAGIVAGIAGLLFLLSASPKALKLLSSPRGMVALVTVMLAAICLMGWQWSTPAAPAESTVADTATGQPDAAEKTATETEPEADPAEDVAKAPKRAARTAGTTLALPLMPMPGGFVGSIPMLWMPPPGIVRLPSFIVAGFKKAVAHHHASSPAHPAATPGGTPAETAKVTTGRASHVAHAANGSPKPVRAASQPRTAKPSSHATASRTGNAGKPAGSQGHASKPNAITGPGGLAQRPMTRAQQNHLRNVQAAAALDLEMGIMSQGQTGGMPHMGGGMPHMGGAGHAGGMHHVPNHRP